MGQYLMSELLELQNFLENRFSNFENNIRRDLGNSKDEVNSILTDLKENQKELFRELKKDSLKINSLEVHNEKNIKDIDGIGSKVRSIPTKIISILTIFTLLWSAVKFFFNKT